MGINRIGISDHHTAWEKRRTEKNIPGTNFAVHMADTNMAIANRDSSTTDRRTTFTDTVPGRDSYIAGASGICTAGIYSRESISQTQESDLPVETVRYKNEDAREEDTNTHSEVIVRPDGSRVLMITMDVGGTQATMSLQISEPTDMQNDISMSKDDRSELPANAAVLTSDEISGSVSEE